MFMPNLDTFRGIFGLPGKITKMKAYTKLTGVMCCQIFDRKSVAPSVITENFKNTKFILG